MVFPSGRHGHLWCWYVDSGCKTPRESVSPPELGLLMGFHRLPLQWVKRGPRKSHITSVTLFGKTVLHVIDLGALGGDLDHWTGHINLGHNDKCSYRTKQEGLSDRRSKRRCGNKTRVWGYCQGKTACWRQKKQRRGLGHQEYHHASQLWGLVNSE